MKNIKYKPELILASMQDYESVQNMARFYVYDMSRFCTDLHGWKYPSNGLFEYINLKSYFVDTDRKAFIVRVDYELAGFILLNKNGSTSDCNWNVGEFFIMGKFQGTGIAALVAEEIFCRFPGIWEVNVIPQNLRALHFWRKVIHKLSHGDFTEELKTIQQPSPQSMIVLRFKSSPSRSHQNITIIGISGISGAGKTTLAKSLGNSLQATTIFWDDYDDISYSPPDYVKWWNNSRDYNEWKYDALANVLSSLKEGKEVICPATKRNLIPTKYIVFDSPLGYKHKATGRYIDFLVFLNTPLDIAMGRRLLRDFEKNMDGKKILEEIDFYLRESRPLFLYDDEKELSNLIINDGSTEEQIRYIQEAIQ